MVTAELIFHDFEETSKEMTFQSAEDMFLVRFHKSFKYILTKLSSSLLADIGNINDLKNFSQDNLRQIYSKFKDYSFFYDKLNDLCYNENYLNDDELKRLLTSFTRNLHKIENVSYKYLMKDTSVSSNGNYIKEGISAISQETIGSRLSSKL